MYYDERKLVYRVNCISIFFFRRSTIKSGIFCIILDDFSQEKTFNDTESSHDNFQTILPEESEVDAETTSENPVVEITSTTSVND